MTLGILDAYYAVVYLLLWSFLTFFLEAEHKHPYRGQVNQAIPLTVFFSAAVASAVMNPISLLPLAALGRSAWLYVKKDVIAVIGCTSCLPHPHSCKILMPIVEAL
jgi:hypothetical protein